MNFAAMSRSKLENYGVGDLVNNFFHAICNQFPFLVKIHMWREVCILFYKKKKMLTRWKITKLLKVFLNNYPNFLFMHRWHIIDHNAKMKMHLVGEMVAPFSWHCSILLPYSHWLSFYSRWRRIFRQVRHLWHLHVS